MLQSADPERLGHKGRCMEGEVILNPKKYRSETEKLEQSEVVRLTV